MESLELRTALLPAALEAINAPAFVMHVSGRVLFANSLAGSWLEADSNIPEVARREWRAATSSRFEITRLNTPGGEYALVLARQVGASVGNISRASARWKLTPRQREVLALVARGTTNKQVAKELGCSERTVEVHVAAIIRKARVTSRTTLIAALFNA